jgi:hypothetical protein
MAAAEEDHLQGIRAMADRVEAATTMTGLLAGSTREGTTMEDLLDGTTDAAPGTIDAAHHLDEPDLALAALDATLAALTAIKEALQLGVEDSLGKLDWSFLDHTPFTKLHRLEVLLAQPFGMDSCRCRCPANCWLQCHALVEASS